MALPHRVFGLTLLALTACDDPPTTPQPLPTLEVCAPARTLQPVLSGTAAAWLSVWSPSPQAAWFAGGDTTTGTIAHYDGTQLRPVVIPEGPALWWIWGTDDTHLWAVGEGGRILRRDAAGWRAEDSGLDEKAMLWGIWGSTATDLWAVGGSNRRGGAKAIVLRSNGDGHWRRLDDPALPIEDASDPLVGRNLYKVWGAAPDDVHLVGEDGLALRWDGTRLSASPVEPRELMFTVAGHGADRWAVGGLSAGHAWQWQPDAQAWRAANLPALNPLNGVSVSGDDLLLVGARGLVVQGLPGDQCRQRPDPAWATHTFHAAHTQPGARWVVGGDLSQFTDGVILSDVPPPSLEAPWTR
jgi:hypothetical protein